MKKILLIICVLSLLGCGANNKRSCPDGKRLVMVSPYKLKGDTNSKKKKSYKYECVNTFDKNGYRNSIKRSKK